MVRRMPLLAVQLTVEMVGQKGTVASRIADQVEEHGGTPFLRELPV